MNIIYNKKVELPAFAVTTISHQVLNKDIQDFISEYDVEQSQYYFKSLPHLFRLYLNNEDCIDCQL
jgi:hypothetical protein